jgi:UDP-N-acetylglucosamine 2-epimerase
MRIFHEVGAKPNFMKLAPVRALINPLGYLEFFKLQRHDAFLITDSGGIQEETTFLGVPYFTVRQNTECPITLR